MKKLKTNFYLNLQKIGCQEANMPGTGSGQN